jgi:plastocyanin
MKSLRVSAVAVSVLALGATGPTVFAKDKVSASITVAFGTGNNNQQAGSTPNHHVLPQEFKVRLTSARKLDGTLVPVPATVNFVVSGFHWIWVYRDGVSLEEVAARVPQAGTFVDYEAVVNGVSNVLAKGIFPGTPPNGFKDGAPFPLSSAQNRTDTIAFSTPGTYLIICNVRGHLVDGMYAWVRVLAEDEEDDDDDE